MLAGSTILLRSDYCDAYVRFLPNQPPQLVSIFHTKGCTYFSNVSPQGSAILLSGAVAPAQNEDIEKGVAQVDQVMQQSLEG